jgi:uncharacterized protein YndB with AHSA1/START domain
MTRDLRFERFLRHPPERVWHTLTDSRALAEWYMANDFLPVVGRRFTFRTDPGPGFDGILRGTVLQVDPPRRLVYTFIGGSMRHETRVSWTLSSKDGGTLLRLEHTGFTGLADISVSFVLGFGWQRFLRNLPALLARLETSPSAGA